MRTFLRYWAPMLAYCGGIYALSSSSVVGTLDVFLLLDFPHSDKLIHAIEFGVLGMLAVRALGKGTAWSLTPKEAIVGAVMFCLAFGALDEVHQSYVPGRYSEFLDLFADVGGATVAALGYARAGLLRVP